MTVDHVYLVIVDDLAVKETIIISKGDTFIVHTDDANEILVHPLWCRERSIQEFALLFCEK